MRTGIARPWRSRQPHALVNHESPIVLRPSYTREDHLNGLVRDEALASVEAALLVLDEPVTPRRLARLADLPDTGEARRLVDRLNELYARGGSAFYVEELAGGYQLLTRPELRPWLDRLLVEHEDLHLSGPMLETLAIVAYRQPICRADIEAIRGVQSGEILRQLMDKNLVRFAGRDESLGRPYLYATTKGFLRAFGLRNLHELPLVELLKDPGRKTSAKSVSQDDDSDQDDLRTDDGESEAVEASEAEPADSQKPSENG